MVKTQSSNFDAEWRNGNDSEMRCESLAGTSPSVDGSLLRRPGSVGPWQISFSSPPSCGFTSI